MARLDGIREEILHVHREGRRGADATMSRSVKSTRSFPRVSEEEEEETEEETGSSETNSDYNDPANRTRGKLRGQASALSRGREEGYSPGDRDSLLPSRSNFRNSGVPRTPASDVTG